MTKIVGILQELSDEDIQWILNTGIEEKYEPDTILLNEGEFSDNIYIVMEGMLGIFLSGKRSRQIESVGPGEIVGEMSFLENTPTLTTVITLESSILLPISKEILTEKILDNSGFGARFYKGIGMVVSQRLKQAMIRIDYILEQIELAKKLPSL